MRVGFIGCGRVCFSLSQYFIKKNVVISGFSSKSENSAREFEKAFLAPFYSNIIKLIDNSDIIFITVPDDEIFSVSNKINKSYNKIFCHTSGVYSSDILDDLFKNGASVVSLHPMASITKTYIDFSKIFFTLEGKGEKKEEFISFLNNINISFTQIKSCDKILYHTAAVFASNYLVSLIDASKNILKDINFSDEEILKILKPLIVQTMINIEKEGTEKALTGPISRGDVKTVSLHLNALSNNKEALDLYKALAQKTINLALKNESINKDLAKQMENIMKNEE